MKNFKRTAKGDALKKYLFVCEDEHDKLDNEIQQELDRFEDEGKEPTRTESMIQEAMTEMMKGKTSYVIAHRLSTIKVSAKILYMQDGDILEVGNHQELMAKDGLYAKLYNSQFSDNN